jgi:hypothetical protein
MKRLRRSLNGMKKENRPMPTMGAGQEMIKK